MCIRDRKKLVVKKEQTVLTADEDYSALSLIHISMCIRARKTGIAALWPAPHCPS